MSSNQDSVRQFSINRWLALSLGLCFLLVFSLTVNFAVSGIKHGIRYRAELQGEVASREELENAVKQYETEKQKIQKDLQDVHRMSEMVRRVLGIKGQGLLGQGGGGFSTGEESEHESTPSMLEMQPALTPISTDFIGGSLIDQVIQVKRKITPIYEHVKVNATLERAKPWILPLLVPIDDEIPSYWFSSGFGYRSHPLTGKRHFHSGLDIAAPWGTPVIAAADGVITEVTKDPSFGNMVEIEHKASQMKTLYGHLQSHAEGLQVGQAVKRDDIIGYVGNSGRSTGTHLHYGVYAKDRWQNPKNYIILSNPPN
jgi:murein DD-endopeptidase MepM/ murein hydrolase activator NlpD